ncbi:alcohol dehydrogenase catalytic domain-containing protein [Streptomyces sp. NPDC000941]
MARDDWGFSTFPMVPGHEITGIVSAAGADVTANAVGDRVAVGMLLGWCGSCVNCWAGREQYCAGGGTPPDAGGFSERIVVDQDVVHSLPPGLDMAAAAPLMCAGRSPCSAGAWPTRTTADGSAPPPTPPSRTHRAAPSI